MASKKNRSGKGPDDWCVEIIAVWRRDKDGTELQLRRDGNAFFKMPSGKTQHAVSNTNFDLIEKWRVSGEGRGFKRVEGES